MSRSLVGALGRARVALRLARRTSLRSLGRSTLIALMVALPVAGLAGISVVAESMTATTAERITTQLGETEARINMVLPPDESMVQNPLEPQSYMVDVDAEYLPVHHSPEDAVLAPAALFPSGTRILPVFSTSVTLTSATGVASLAALEGDMWDPSFAGRYDVVTGHTPTEDDEIMVTASALPRLGVGIGGTIDVLEPTKRTVTVVGILDDQTEPDSKQIVFGRDGALTGVKAGDRVQQTDFFLPDTSVSWVEVQQLNARGAAVLSHDVLLNPPAPGTYEVGGGGDSRLARWLVLTLPAVLFAIFEVALLAGAAFTVTARQQQRTLATVASTGATRPTLFQIVSAGGVVLGAAGGILGIGLGIAGGAAYMRITADGSATQYFGFHIPWVAMLGIAAFAVLVGWLAAIVPAWAASKIDLVAALRGARRPPVASKKRPVLGFVLLIGGAGLALGGGAVVVILHEIGGSVEQAWATLPILMIAGGAILAQVGFILCSSLVLRFVARLLSRAGIGARLASRDAARNPGRSVPALAAIMTTVFTSVVVMSLIAGFQQAARDTYKYDTMPGQVRTTLEIYDPVTGQQTPFDDPSAVENALTTTLDAAEIRTLAAVRITDPTRVEEGLSDGGKPVAIPTVSPQNLCPRDPLSPEYSLATGDPASAEGKAAQADPRCASDLVLSVEYNESIYIGTRDDLALILGRQPSDAAVSMLVDGGVVSLYDEFVENDQVTLSWWSTKQRAEHVMRKPGEKPVRVETLRAVVDKPQHPLWKFGLFMTPETANSIGLEFEDVMVLASLDKLPTDAQIDAMYQAIAAATGTDAMNVNARVERGPADDAALWAWALLGLTTMIAIAAAGVAIGLSRFDGRADDATLASLGSGRVLRRNFAFWQAIVIAGVGAVLGSIVGLLPPLALANSATDIPFVPPWIQIAIVAFVLPLVIACGSWLISTRSRIAARRTTIA